MSHIKVPCAICRGEPEKREGNTVTYCTYCVGKGYVKVPNIPYVPKWNYQLEKGEVNEFD